jgi:hypothetical protein
MEYSSERFRLATNEDLQGRYIRFLIDRPVGIGSLKKGDIARITSRNGIDDLKESHAWYGGNTGQLRAGEFEILPLDFKLETTKQQITKQEEKTMKKFKNKIVVTGPVTLLEAFTKELDKLGYKSDEPWNTDRPLSNHIKYLSLNEEFNGSYTNHTHDCSPKPLFVLPNSWDRALELAAETVSRQEELIKEAKQRFPIPFEIQYLDGAVGILSGYNLRYDETTDTLYASSKRDIVYQKGKWAEAPKSIFVGEKYALCIEGQYKGQLLEFEKPLIFLYNGK